ncbi:hypothetical protein ACFYXS_25010 [Streptomyces sp. NPDC002574]|uniref:hypothetical protein n=1 Tax=Streptomyces sp. NPDC002574 TaxID=3364652 RepID=UPI0036786EBF
MRRTLAVHFAPSALFVAYIWMLIRAGAFSGRVRWHHALPGTLASAAATLLAISACAALLGLLLHPFQVRAVRVLEGYWDRWAPTSRLAGVLVEYQRRKWVAMRDVGTRPLPSDSSTAQKPLREQIRDHEKEQHQLRIRGLAMRRLAALPPQDVLLPTALGNALRAGELSAGERYGLTTLTSWPRILPQVSAPLGAALSSARDSLDSSVNLCHSFLASVALSAVALYDEPGQWWLVLLLLALAALAYKGAVTAAQAYAGLMYVVYDLHRFDLVEALRHPMPERGDEWGAFQRITDLLARRPARSGPYEADGSADAQEM